MGSTRPQQRAGAGVNSSAGSEHVVDQYQASAGYIGSMLSWHNEGALDVFCAFRF
jgi:hypothetical protein